MALTIDIAESFVVGDRKAVVADVTFDSSYPAGGEAVTASDFGLENSITHVFCNALRDPDTVDNALLLDWDATNSKLIAVWGDYNPAAEGALSEVDDTTTLAAYSARIVVVGK